MDIYEEELAPLAKQLQSYLRESAPPYAWVECPLDSLCFFTASPQRQKKAEPPSHLPPSPPPSSLPPARPSPSQSTPPPSAPAAPPPKPTAKRTPPLQKKEPQKPPLSKEFFQLTPPPMPIQESFDDVRSALQKVAPTLPLLAPPSLTTPSSSALWVLLIHTSSKKEKLFWQNVTHVLSTWIQTTALYFVEGPHLPILEWSSIRCVLSSGFPEASLREKTDVPCILLSPAKHYLENPLEKAQLWTTLFHAMRSQ